MPVQVPAGAVVVLSRPRVGVAGQDLRIAQRDTGVPAFVIAAWRGECGLMWRRMPAVFAIRTTIREASRRSVGLPESGRSTSGPDVRWPRQASSSFGVASTLLRV